MDSTALQTVIWCLQLSSIAIVATLVGALAVLLIQIRSANWKRNVAYVSLAAAGLATCCGALSWCVSHEYQVRREEERAKRYADSSLVHVGDEAPAFELTDVDNVPFSLHNTRGKVVLLNFFSTSCGPCKQELPYLNELNNQFGGTGAFAAIAIGRGETSDVLREFRDKNKLSVRVAADPDKAVFGSYATGTIPRTIIISPDGEILYSKAEFYKYDIAAIKKILTRHL